MDKKLLTLIACLWWLLAQGCGSSSGEQDCVPATDNTPKTVAVERTKLKLEQKGDWCRACVMGMKGYASCQRVYATDEKEERVSLRQRALDKACVDAGYEVGNCPARAVIGILCKGEKEPDDMPTAAQALRRFFEGKPIRQPRSGTDETAAGEKSAKPQVKESETD